MAALLQLVAARGGAFPRPGNKGSRDQCGKTCSVNIVIVISKLLKRHSKAKRRAPAYSRALRKIRGIFPKNSPWEAQVRVPEGVN